MKLFTSASIFLIMALPTTAQIKKGQFLVGGSISFESVKNDRGAFSTTNESTNLSLSPNIGYFIIEKLAGGVRVSSSSFKDETSDYHSTNFSISPFARYYFLPSTKKLNAFLDLGYVSSKLKREYPSLYPLNKQKSTGYAVSGGPVMFLNNHIALEFTVGYTHLTTDNGFNIKTKTINTGLGLQIHLGKIKTKGK